MDDKASEGAPYRRRYGVIRRVGVLGGRPGNAFLGSPNVIDSGEDAPLTGRGRAIYRSVVIVLALGITALVLFALAR